MGDIVADALLYASHKTPGAEADLAVWNSGGIRADLTVPAGAGPPPVTYAQAFSVLPFGNELIVKSITGETLIQMFEEQFGGAGGSGDRVRILQVSDGFTYRYDSTRPFGQRIDRSSIRLRGEPIVPSTPCSSESITKFLLTFSRTTRRSSRLPATASVKPAELARARTLPLRITSRAALLWGRPGEVVNVVDANRPVVAVLGTRVCV
jgi:hypothetical protein